MPNPGQPTIQEGDHGEAVKRAQRALRRTPDTALQVDGNFGPATKTAVTEFQQGSGLAVDGVVGPATWAALPDGGPMPTLEQGSHGNVVKSLQTVLANGAGQWNTGPGAADGDFGPLTKTSVPSPRLRSRHSSSGAASPATASSATRRGPSRCTP